MYTARWKATFGNAHYYWYHTEVIQSPDRAISIMFDGINHSHTNVPLLSKWTSHKTVSNRLIGVKVLGIGTRSCTCKWTISRRIKRIFFLDSSVRLLFKICVFRSVSWLSHGGTPTKKLINFFSVISTWLEKKMKPFVQNSKVGRSWGLRPQRYFIFSPTGIFWFRHTLHFGFEHNTAIQLQAPPILIPKAQGCGFAPFQTLGHIWYLYLLSNQHTFHR